jgi:hypothetical protein
VILLDSLLIGGLKFVLGKVAEAVDAERDDEALHKQDLMETQMRFELGEIDEASYAAREREILAALREIQERKRGPASKGALKVTGVEAEIAPELSQPHPRRR